ncbi:hypothetical protein SUGI_1469140 [Cryptomeria japonica]|uniref:Uncharacterized protein n=1 Tax=Cryptomeria japonica TaxID=3369 RepID=A0AAD3NMP5_CRYJA|nr:hypothetical protein SUGI_1449900 [Cryptomeria japonica]GLJ58701.1 hypothetical protein SUGI_1469140 [Cryptomeria japonica]
MVHFGEDPGSDRLDSIHRLEGAGDRRLSGSGIEFRVGWGPGTSIIARHISTASDRLVLKALDLLAKRLFSSPSHSPRRQPVDFVDLGPPAAYLTVADPVPDDPVDPVPDRDPDPYPSPIAKTGAKAETEAKTKVASYREPYTDPPAPVYPVTYSVAYPVAYSVDSVDAVDPVGRELTSLFEEGV